MWSLCFLQDQNTNLIKITWKKLIKQGAKDSHQVLLLPNDLEKHFIKEHSIPVTLDLKGIRYFAGCSVLSSFFDGMEVHFSQVVVLCF